MDVSQEFFFGVFLPASKTGEDWGEGVLSDQLGVSEPSWDGPAMAGAPVRYHAAPWWPLP